MQRFTVLLLGLAVGSGLLACSDRDPSTGVQDRTARVQFFNATTDAASLTAQVEGVVRATAIGFGASSSCATLDAGVSEITFMQPGVATPIATLLTNLVGGGRYIVVASGAANNARIVVVETGGTAPPATSTSLRVVNATGTLTNVDVHLTAPNATLGNPTQAGLLAHGATPSFVVPSGDRQLRLTAAGTSNVLLDRSLSLPGGQFRTLVIAESGQGGYQPFLVERCP